jgi:hypothetical protein
VWYEVVKELSIALAAAATAFAAWRGVHVWREQLRGTERFNLARQILRHAHTYVDEMDRVRHWMSMGNEADDPPEDDPKRDKEHYREYYRTRTIYEKLLSRLSDVDQLLYADSIEAEALFGPGAREPIDQLREIGRDVQIAIEWFVDSKYPNRIGDFPDEQKRIVFKTNSRKYPDEISTRADESLSRIEANMRPHLSRFR